MEAAGAGASGEAVGIAASVKAAVGITASGVALVSGVGSAAITPTSAPAVTAAPVSTVAIPRARADKHSATKPLWTVVAVWCAGVRVISVVPVVTYWRSIDVAWADSDANSNPSLRLRVGNRQSQDCEQRQISQVTHITPHSFQSLVRSGKPS